jgi:hypothetical protein
MWSRCFYLHSYSDARALEAKKFPTPVRPGKTTWSATSVTAKAETLVRH